jgi:DNA modification methylase
VEVEIVISTRAASVPCNSRALSVEYKALIDLKPYSCNARTHTTHQIRQIAESIRVFGFTNPVLVDSNNRIIAGHGRVEAVKLLGMDRVPTIRLDQLSEDQIRAYIIADNKLAENAGWDKSILAIELQHLLTLDCADFDVTITGFEVPEIDLILQEATQEDPEDIIEPVIAGEAVTKPGDLWQLGKHRILCGSALEETSFSVLMGSHRAHMAFVDSPYNIVIEGNVSGKGIVKHGDFKMASGEMDEAQFTRFLTDSLGLLARYTISGSVHFVCMDWRHQRELLAAGGQSYDTLLNLCVWVKNTGGQGSFYRSRHELVYVFRNGKSRSRNNIQLGKYGRYRTNVWEYPAVRGLSQQQSDEGNLLALHPTVKPVALVADAILDCSAPGNMVLDSFLGSGSTLMAAQRTGRTCYGIEIDPVYVDVAIRRWQNSTGEAAVHAQTGKRFNEVADQKEVQHA